MTPSEAEIAGRIVLAVVLAGLIGLEREINDHPAGLRTHISVALGAALFTIAGTYGFDEFASDRDSTNVDISVERVASNIVVGVGFLGGGAILKYGATVKGLTTAASLWVTAAIGMGVALGSYFATVVTAAALLLALVGLRAPRRWIAERWARSRETVVIRLVPGHGAQSVVSELNTIDGISIRSLRVHEQDGQTVLTADMSASAGIELEPTLGPLVHRDDVESVDVS
jgi:putative Mg2+ transporter-C (MgtC) family protein